MGEFSVYLHKLPNGEVFYVGKGAGGRPYSKSGRTEAWHAKASMGFSVEIFQGNITDKEARQIEANQIQKHSETIVNVRTIDNSKLIENTTKMVSFKIDIELLSEFEAWRSQQELKPSKTAVFEAALRKYIGVDSV